MSMTGLVLLTGAQALQRSLDVIANNVANANTTGFKREGVSFNTLMEKTGTGQNPVQLVYDRATFRDIANGPIKPTGNELDVAISGQGYLQVQTKAGGTAYTRSGSFTLNSEGQITTQSGEPILGDGGQAITMPEGVSQINISSDGTITAHVGTSTSLSQLGKIALVKFNNEQQMQAAGGGLYTTSETPQPSSGTGDAGSIVQGALEDSNVNSVAEMTSMVEIERSYQEIMNLVNGQHDLNQQALGTLAKTTA